ncbi:MAG: polysaccharide deacetylase family protein [Acidobacteria bacterium]|nr:polysaccharide deacetylase family protein [Acidobacteriota bacterium]
MKKVVRHLLRVSGAFAPFRLANRNKALILMYHRFTPHEDGAATSARAFEQQLKYLKTHYQVVPLAQIAQQLLQNKSLPPKLAAITIDDGYYDAYEIAFPLLQRYQLPATLFVVTDFIERKTWLWTDKLKFMTPRTTARWLEFSLNDSLSRMELSDARSRQLAAAQINAWLKTQSNQVKEQAILKIADSLGVSLPEVPPDEYRPLSWREVGAMDKGGVAIGSHTVTHPILTRIDEERLRYELRESKTQLEAVLGRAVELFCYPNGDYDQQVVREVERAGYRCAVTTDYGLNEADIAPLCLRRLAAENDLSRFAQSTSGFEAAKLRLRAVRRLPTTKAAADGAQILQG